MKARRTRRHRLALGLVACAAACLIAATAPTAQQAPSPTRSTPAQATPAPATPVFQGGVNLVLVDVVVRDKSGAVVKGLRAEDFELEEDGKPQRIQSFAYDEIGTSVAPLRDASMLSAAATLPAAPLVVAAGAPVPMTTSELAGHRLLVLLFDTSSMEPDEVQMSADSALAWVKATMSSSDLVAVASVGSSLQILTDFTSDKTKLQSVLAAFSAAEGTAPAPIDSSTVASDEADNAATADTVAADSGAQELDTFNNDVRLRALTTMAEALTPVQQKKSILYFSSGMQRNGADNQVELRKAVNAAVRANVAIYPVDARGLQAIVPGGGARERSRGGVGAFSGQAVARQFTQLAAQQETLQTLASDTGGTAFTDTNDFGEAFAKVVKDTSAYYILGFVSANPSRDGRFRRIRVRVKARTGLRIEARDGYYADRDFAHTARSDREVQLQEQLLAALPATDVPVFVTAGWFRLSSDKYYVPLSVAVPGSAITPSAGKATFDVAGIIRDERGAPVGRIRDTLTLPAAEAGAAGGADVAVVESGTVVGAGTVAGPLRQVLYQTSVTLPPGRFVAKVAVRENATGQMGTFETSIVVPELKPAPVKVSSVILSTQLQGVGGRKTNNPLVRDGVALVPSLTHIVGRGQTLYVYYEVYDPALENGSPQLRTSLVFYRGKVNVFETPVVERTSVEAPDRHAALFQFEVPLKSLAPGLYTCQINIVDEVSGRFAFPRLELYVR